MALFTIVLVHREAPYMYIYVLVVHISGQHYPNYSSSCESSHSRYTNSAAVDRVTKRILQLPRRITHFVPGPQSSTWRRCFGLTASNSAGCSSGPISRTMRAVTLYLQLIILFRAPID